MNKLTSYILIKVLDEYVPVKAGGYEGLTELSEEKGMSKKEIIDIARNDIRNMNQVWIPKIYVEDFFKEISIKNEIKIKIDKQNYISIPIKRVSNWSRGSKQVSFNGRPLEKLSENDLIKIQNLGLEKVGIKINEETDGYESYNINKSSKFGEKSLIIASLKKQFYRIVNNNEVQVFIDNKPKRWVKPESFEVKDLNYYVMYQNRKIIIKRPSQKIVKKEYYIDPYFKYGYWKTVGVLLD